VLVRPTASSFASLQRVCPELAGPHQAAVPRCPGLPSRGDAPDQPPVGRFERHEWGDLMVTHGQKRWLTVRNFVAASSEKPMAIDGSSDAARGEPPSHHETECDDGRDRRVRLVLPRVAERSSHVARHEAPRCHQCRSRRPRASPRVRQIRASGTCTLAANGRVDADVSADGCRATGSTNLQAPRPADSAEYRCSASANGRSSSQAFAAAAATNRERRASSWRRSNWDPGSAYNQPRPSAVWIASVRLRAPSLPIAEER
jgi:hypothetical protein